MRKVLIMAAALMVSLPFVNAQDTVASRQALKLSDKCSINVYGFVRNYFTYDSRKTYTVVGGEYNMLPYDVDMVDGVVDLNDVASMQMQALTSRIGVAITGPMVLGWETSGKLEGDFGGFGTNNTVLRLRLAYVKLQKEGRELLMGQDWHPLSGDIMPEVLGMAAGAPFRPHSRTPQIRATRYWGSLGCSAALLWQLQYMNNGPESATSLASVASLDFARQALWPEAFLGFNFKRLEWYAQLGVDAQLLRPRTHAFVYGCFRNGYAEVDETVASITPTLYVQYTDNRWAVKFRTLLAQNTSHLNQLVGYGITGVEPDGSYRYAPLSSAISYLNIAYGTKVRANLFLGYMKNLGANEDLYDFGEGNYRIYMKGGNSFTHLNSVYRVAPSVSYNLPHFNLGLEYEWTACTFGDLGSNGSILLNDQLHNVANHRICLLVKYNF